MKTSAAFLLGSLLAVSAGAQTDPAIPAPPTVGGTNGATARTLPVRRPFSDRTAAPPTVGPAAPFAATTIPAPGAVATTPPEATATPAPPSGPAAPPVAGTVAAPSEAAASAGSDDETPTIRFSAAAAPLQQVIDRYFELTGKIPIISGKQSPNTVNAELPIYLKVASPMTRKEAIAYLETVLGANGITLIPVGDKFVKVLPDAGVAQAGGEFSKLKADQLPDSGSVIQQIVQLKYAAMEDVVPVITPFAKTPASIIQIPSTQTLVLRDYTENVKRMLEVIAKIDTVSELEIKPEVIPIKYAFSSDIANVLGTLTASGAGITVGQSRGASGLGGARSGGFGARSGASANGGRGGIGGGGYGGYNNGGVNTLQNSSTFNRPGGALAGANNFQSNLRNIIQRAASGGNFEVLGNVKIIADERTNSLLIFAGNTDMIMIKSIIEKLDVVLAQVLIESIIMEVSLNNNLDYGVSIYQPPKNSGRFTGGGGANNGGFFGALTNITSPPAGFGYTGGWGNDLEVAAKAVAGNGDINVLSRPRIQTSHAVPATLRIGEQYPFVTGTITDINGGARSQYSQTFIGIDMQITPLINPDGLVVMDISQDIQQRGPSVTIDRNPVPTTTQRSASAKVAVHDRDIVVLGGFIRNDRSTTEAGVPFLKDIPGLGVLFRSSSKSNTRTEMMVLIRPTVLKTPEAASQAAMDMKDEMPALKASADRAQAEDRKAARAAELETRRKLGLKD